MKRLLVVALALTSCTSAAHASRSVSTDVVPTVSAVLSRQAAPLGKAACAAWTRTPRDVAESRALQAAALHGARAAAALDPHWSALADGIAEVQDLQRQYAKADVSHAYSLAPKLDAARKRVLRAC